MSTKHTPTPWIAEGQQIVAEENGYRVAIVSSPHPRARGKERMEDLEYCQGNTAFIVRACNSYHHLVAACKEVIESAEEFHRQAGISQLEEAECIKAVRAALAAAEAA
jgi:hypothetical protein